MTGWRKFAVTALGCCALSANAANEKIRVAAASNLVMVMEPLVRAFTAEHTQIELSISHAATGNLIAQIRHGAPFDVLLAADLNYPRALIESGHAEEQTLRTFAHGVLMLWPQPPAGQKWQTVLTGPGLRRLAVANPDTAPYGKATKDMLTAAGFWDQIKPRVVWGENVAQTLQFVHSGNADFGFVAASLLSGNHDLRAGMIIELGEEALPHGAIRLGASRSPGAAKLFLDWLEGAAARIILIEHGYRVP